MSTRLDWRPRRLTGARGRVRITVVHAAGAESASPGRILAVNGERQCASTAERWRGSAAESKLARSVRIRRRCAASAMLSTRIKSDIDRNRPLRANATPRSSPSSDSSAVDRSRAAAERATNADPPRRPVPPSDPPAARFRRPIHSSPVGPAHNSRSAARRSIRAGQDADCCASFPLLGGHGAGATPKGPSCSNGIRYRDVTRHHARRKLALTGFGAI